MFSQIHDNLHRQFKGLELLYSLLDEELTLLGNRDVDAITALEFSIHELLRQIAVERSELKETMQSTTLLDYANLIPEEDGNKVRGLYHLIDTLEQRCARQAGHNAELSLALMDQSQGLLSFLYEQITPTTTTTYGAAGRVRQDRPHAALISGRL